MATKPATKPTWATDPNTTAEPEAAVKATGWTAIKPPFQWMNWLQNLFCKWIDWFDQQEDALSRSLTSAWENLADVDERLDTVETTLFPLQAQVNSIGAWTDLHVGASVVTPAAGTYTIPIFKVSVSGKTAIVNFVVQYDDVPANTNAIEITHTNLPVPYHHYANMGSLGGMSESPYICFANAKINASEVKCISVTKGGAASSFGTTGSINGVCVYEIA